MNRSMTTGRRMLAGVAAGALALTMIPLVGAAASSALTPADSAVISPAEDVASLIISGTRDGRLVKVEGAANNVAVGTILRPMVKFPGQRNYNEGVAKVAVTAGPDGAAAGENAFAWQRKTNKKIYVYFKGQDILVQSARVIIRAR